MISNHVDTAQVNYETRHMYFDTNYNSTFALMHEDYMDDSIPIDLGLEQIRVHVLSPVDLAISKIARFSDIDKEDISELVRLGLTNAKEIEDRATSALVGYIGGLAMLKVNLQEAVNIAKNIEIGLKTEIGLPRIKF